MKRLFALLLAVICTLAPLACFAESETDKAGNVFTSSGMDADANGDVFALLPMGASDSFSGNISGSLIGVAGEDLKLNGTEIGGSVHFVAAGGIECTSASARNLTVVTAETLSLDAGCKINGVYAVANEAIISCKLDTLALTSTTVYIFDQIGEVSITADNVYIKSGLDVSGFDIEATNEPMVFDEKPVNSVSYKESEYADTLKYTVYTDESSAINVSNIIFSVIGTFVCTALLLILFKKQTAKCSLALKTNFGAVIGFGMVLLIGTPIAAIFVAFTFIGAPLSIVAALLYIAVLILADSITACALSEVWLPKLNKFLSAFIVGAAIVVLRALPFVGGIVTFISYVVAFGTLIKAFTSKDDTPQQTQIPTDFQNPYTV